MLNKDIINEIKGKIEIVDLVGRYVNLQKVGGYYRGLCPFHSDNDPSFYVNQAKQFFHCFGCGEKGDAITFYQKMENISFSEAIVRLADIVGYSLPVESRSENEYEKYTRILTTAAKIYNQELNSGRHDEIVDYISNGRKLSRSTIEEFRIGFVVENRTSSRVLMSNTGATENDLVKSGLFYKREGRLLERFSGRIVIPIQNETGKTIAFGGRATPNGAGAKYINSPETRYFSKGKTLFNLHRAKKLIKEFDYVVIVEGFFDVMTMYEAGITNSVGVLGTALTSWHLRNLKRYTDNLMFIFDSDEAGKNAAMKSLDLAEEIGFTTAVAQIYKYKDPGELLQARGSVGLKELLTQAVPGAVYRVNYFASRVRIDTPQGKQKLIEFMKPFLQKYQKNSNIAGFQMMVKALAEKTSISEETLLKGLSPRRNRNASKSSKRSAFKSGERDLLAVYFRYKNMRRKVVRLLELGELSEPCSKIIRKLKNAISLEELLDDVDKEIGEELMVISEIEIDELTANRIISGMEKKADKKIITEQIEEIRRKLANTTDEETKKVLLIRSVELSRFLQRSLKGGEHNGKG